MQLAQLNSGKVNTGTKLAVMMASKKAAEVWPEGKLNSSEAIISALNEGIATGGLGRFRPFFSSQ